MGLRILHIFKKSYSGQKHQYLGSVKDIRSRTEYFRSRGIECEELLVSAKHSYRNALEKTPQDFLERFDAVLLEMTFSPGALKALRKRLPHGTLMVRSHNAELIHRYHWACAQGVSRVAVRLIGQAVKNCGLDILSGWRSDFVLPISKWEADFYWKKLIPGKKVKYVPFFMPEPYASELKQPGLKKNLCIHLGSSLNNPLISDATKNFIHAVRNIDSRCSQWEFCITGALPDCNLKIPDRIQWLGLLPNPYIALRQAKAMALLSDFGMGFKTKVLEAVLARAFVILPTALYKRQPSEILPYCIPVNLNKKLSFLEALEKCNQDFPDGDPNSNLRRHAFEVMDQILGITTSKAEQARDSA
jgi:hypothetical protein